MQIEECNNWQKSLGTSFKASRGSTCCLSNIDSLLEEPLFPPFCCPDPELSGLFLLVSGGGVEEASANIAGVVL